MTTQTKTPPKDKDTVTDKALAATTQLAEQAQEVSKVAGETAQHAIDDTRDAVAKAGQSARRVAEDQPLMVAAGALVLGVILGLSLKSRN